MKPHIPRKRFGQNFLQDQGVIADILNAVSPESSDIFVEIGPGLAALTRPLLERIPHLHAVEIDRDIVAHLAERFPPERLTVHNADALDFDFGALAREIAPGGQIRLIGNLPYNISTPLLFHLARFGSAISDMHFMLQKEVVDRMVAEPGTPDYGRLGIMLQYRFVMDWLLDVPPESFDPPPKVDSAVVRMTPRPASALDQVDRGTLSALVTAAFSQRRKLLRHSLGPWLDAQGYGGPFDLQRRAEEVGTAEYVALAQSLPARP